MWDRLFTALDGVEKMNDIAQVPSNGLLTRNYWHEDSSPEAACQYIICWILLTLYCFFMCVSILQNRLTNLWHPFYSLTEFSYCAGGSGVFLLCLVDSGSLRLPYLPYQL